MRLAGLLPVSALTDARYPWHVLAVHVLEVAGDHADLARPLGTLTAATHEPSPVAAEIEAELGLPPTLPVVRWELDLAGPSR